MLNHIKVATTFFRRSRSSSDSAASRCFCSLSVHLSSARTMLHFAASRTASIDTRVFFSSLPAAPPRVRCSLVYDGARALSRPHQYPRNGSLPMATYRSRSFVERNAAKHNLASTTHLRVSGATRKKDTHQEPYNDSHTKDTQSAARYNSFKAIQQQIHILFRAKTMT